MQTNVHYNEVWNMCMCVKTDTEQNLKTSTVNETHHHDDLIHVTTQTIQTEQYVSYDDETIECAKHEAVYDVR